MFFQKKITSSRLCAVKTGILCYNALLAIGRGRTLRVYMVSVSERKVKANVMNVLEETNKVVSEKHELSLVVGNSVYGVVPQNVAVVVCLLTVVNE